MHPDPVRTNDRTSFDRIGHPHRGVPGPGSQGLVAWERTIADLFSEAGYATVCLGKWHLGGGQGRWPTDKGFD